MPIVWIGRINAPSKIPPNTSFNISWHIWYIGWPFKKIKIISRISWDSEIYEKIYTVRPWWFIGRITTNVSFSGITKDTTFTISVGYRD